MARRQFPGQFEEKPFRDFAGLAAVIVVLLVGGRWLSDRLQAVGVRIIAAGCRMDGAKDQPLAVVHLANTENQHKIVQIHVRFTVKYPNATVPAQRRVLHNTYTGVLLAPYQDTVTEVSAKVWAPVSGTAPSMCQAQANVSRQLRFSALPDSAMVEAQLAEFALKRARRGERVE